MTTLNHDFIGAQAGSTDVTRTVAIKIDSDFRNLSPFIS